MQQKTKLLTQTVTLSILLSVLTACTEYYDTQPAEQAIMSVNKPNNFNQIKAKCETPEGEKETKAVQKGQLCAIEQNSKLTVGAYTSITLYANYQTENNDSCSDILEWIKKQTGKTPVLVAKNATQTVAGPDIDQCRKEQGIKTWEWNVWGITAEQTEGQPVEITLENNTLTVGSGSRILAANNIPKTERYITEGIRTAIENQLRDKKQKTETTQQISIRKILQTGAVRQNGTDETEQNERAVKITKKELENTAIVGHPVTRKELADGAGYSVGENQTTKIMYTPEGSAPVCLSLRRYDPGGYDVFWCKPGTKGTPLGK